MSFYAEMSSDSEAMGKISGEKRIDALLYYAQGGNHGKITVSLRHNAVRNGVDLYLDGIRISMLSYPSKNFKLVHCTKCGQEVSQGESVQVRSNVRLEGEEFIAGSESKEIICAICNK